MLALEIPSSSMEIMGIGSSQDAALASRFFKTGDRAAMDELFQRYANLAFRIALAEVGNAADAEDIVQAAFLQFLVGKNREIQNVRGWIMKTIINECRDKVKEEARRRKRQEAVMADRAPAYAPDDQKTETIAAAMNAVKALPKDYRMPVWLHHLEGVPFKDIGDALSLPDETVRKRASLGIEQVRLTLAAAGFTAIVVPELLASSTLPSAPATLTASFNAMIAAKGAGAATGAGSMTAKGAVAATSTKVAVTAVLLVLSAAIVAASVYFSGSRFEPKEDGGVPPKTAPTTPKDVDSPSNLDKALTAHWQQPRVIPIDAQGVWPSSLSANGPHVAILAQIQKNVDAKTPAERIKSAGNILIRSGDGGQTWQVNELKIDRLGGDGIAMDASGNCAILAASLTPEGMAALETRADATWQFRQQWYTFSPAAGMSGPQSNWPRDEWSVQPRLAGVPQGTWAFTWQFANRDVLVAAFGAAGKCPEILPPIDYPKDVKVDVATAWAFDDKTAGFVGAIQDNFDGDQMVQYKTEDRGRSWQRQVIAFKTADGSRAPDTLSPLAIAREGKRLVLLARVVFPPEAGAKSYQIFMLSSDDLGEHWNAPRPVSKRHPYNRGDRLSYLHISQGQIGVGWFSHPNSNFHPNSTFVLTSSDDGATWSQYRGFAAAGVTAGPFAVGGDERSMHVAIGKIEGNKCWVMVSSFTSGEWKETKPAAAPDWYKPEEFEKNVKENDF